VSNRLLKVLDFGPLLGGRACFWATLAGSGPTGAYIWVLGLSYMLILLLLAFQPTAWSSATSFIRNWFSWFTSCTTACRTTICITTTYSTAICSMTTSSTTACRTTICITITRSTTVCSMTTSSITTCYTTICITTTRSTTICITTTRSTTICITTHSFYNSM
jgi:hypothetical protein